MLEVVLVVVVLAAVANLAINSSFIEALRQEAPELLASLVLANPRLGNWRTDARKRYWKLILFREYRSRLASCPRSRAWASWLFLVNWIQLATVVVFFIVTVMR
jgi:hypothetical protein